eukprot:CAMPEP_0118644730 /NCGR_PEP_ID=MMETSP0785-20121206/7105_1 /TAXON_ID=91992 /ORGANISM="Bolidomonas pacifica, Strain CCMP 1866" /LENGTH=276 /DNA_ID=CAMNT_0006536529 /DNA_START=1 /DNA_END=831 /DNA_ORIENTATION=-
MLAIIVLFLSPLLTHPLSISSSISRRNLIASASTISILSSPAFTPSASASGKLTDSSDLLFSTSDLPRDFIKSYIQYRPILQFSTDMFVFDILPSTLDPNQWPTIAPIFTQNSARAGQGSPSKIERDFTNPMRILRLAVPPEDSDFNNLQIGEDRFARAMAKVGRIVSQAGGDIPVEITDKDVKAVNEGMEEARLGLNLFISTLNKSVNLNELKLVPNKGETYPRSKIRYLSYVKGLKQCQNRGGTTLANTWGALMVSGTMQESCQIPDANEYFYQ